MLIANSLPYCSLIALLRKHGAFTAWLMSTGGIDPFGCHPVPQGDPIPQTQGQDNPAGPQCVGIPPCKSQFRGCREPPDSRSDTDARPRSYGRCLPGSPACCPPSPAVCPPCQRSCDPSPAPPGPPAGAGAGAGRSGAAPGRSGGGGAAAPSAPCPDSRRIPLPVSAANGGNGTSRTGPGWDSPGWE